MTATNNDKFQESRGSIYNDVLSRGVMQQPNMHKKRAHRNGAMQIQNAIYVAKYDIGLHDSERILICHEQTLLKQLMHEHARATVDDVEYAPIATTKFCHNGART